ncbi:GNAT family N-acetyltransferase [Metaclostridioides mangenotii]|uniref:GNAT family N-acetyltransferase n=1 Tax=Metaclostridioides mangenotii TaxID=1540 RepID=UPI0028F0E527|nr:GNAT family N-acetyltransferase [Clostridioides mangenotii]
MTNYIMDKVLYRKIRKSDFKEVESIINKSFDLYKYVDNPIVLKYFLKTYLYSCLVEQTFNCIAEKDGKVVGVILGQSKKEYQYIKHLPYLLFLGFYSSLMITTAKLFKCDINQYKILSKTYKELLLDSEKDFDGVLTLFAVSQECQGYGVGNELLNYLFQYLKHKSTNNIYLFTDTTCNYGFYDSHGFIRQGDKSITITRENELFTLNIFLYGINII